ncbi:hypothetical protein B0H19DRAFT_471937 [Mycena capillaripes]|nr:hypothetical protein B0H19DRAFT_471937 [Mycena capillaripes]
MASTSSFVLEPLVNERTEIQPSNIVHECPPEILAEIFIRCLPNSRFVIPSPETAPLVICGICRRWREVALSTPRLWSSLFLDLRFESEQTYSKPYESLWLARAQSTPLSLSVKAFKPHASAYSLLKIIVGVSQQWQNIELQLGEISREALSLPDRGSYPFLEKLSIASPECNLPISFLDAPKLRELVLFTKAMQIQLPWNQLTTFHALDIEASPMFGILRNTPNLVDGRFSIRGCTRAALPNSALPLIGLQSLTLGFKGAIRTGMGNLRTDVNLRVIPMAVLNCLQTPALRSLGLSFPYFHSTYNSDVSPFLSFVSRSCFQLHTLTLFFMPATSDTLIECLKATPTLVNLKIQPLHFAVNAVVARLTGPSDFLPKLESFHLVFSLSHVADVTSKSASVVVEMLCWRWAAVGISRLQSFRLAHGGIDKPKFVDAVKSHPEFGRLKENGMALYIGQMTLSDDTFS